VKSLSVRVREADERLFDQEIHLCVPPEDSPKYPAFKRGIEKKRIWLKQRLVETGSVAQIAYHKNQPIAFIEYVHAKNAPVPVDQDQDTALITCINKPKSRIKGVGTSLVKAALKKLKELGFENVKTLVARNPHWINGGIYCKNGFQLEKTFLKHGEAEPLDLLTLNLKGKQAQINKPVTVKLEPLISDALPISIVRFTSGQCPFNAVVHTKLLAALAAIDPKNFVLEVFDSWENCKLARQCGAMYADLCINGKSPFAGPASQEKIEAEILREIDRIKRLG
jgi:GNAT superfamily N-acetyltransferase